MELFRGELGFPDFADRRGNVVIKGIISGGSGGGGGGGGVAGTEEFFCDSDWITGFFNSNDFLFSFLSFFSSIFDGESLSLWILVASNLLAISRAILRADSNDSESSESSEMKKKVFSQLFQSLTWIYY